MLALLLCLGIAMGPSKGHAQGRPEAASRDTWMYAQASHRAAVYIALAGGAASLQGSATASPTPAKGVVELPEGDGKPIATQYCQDCHKLSNLTNAHKSPEEWLATVHLMMERGCPITEDKVPTLVAYLAKNFTPAGGAKPDAASAASAAAPAEAPASTAAAGPDATPPATDAPKPAPAKGAIELPEGDGKPIATQYCQDCHKLSNLTNAHKSPEEWLDTVHLMMERGCPITEDKVPALVAYLAKNFTPVK
jgi:cytochrome c5